SGDLTEPATDEGRPVMRTGPVAIPATVDIVDQLDLEIRIARERADFLKAIGGIGEASWPHLARALGGVVDVFGHFDAAAAFVVELRHRVRDVKITAQVVVSKYRRRIRGHRGEQPR